MIAEIIPETYDGYGTQVSQPFLKRKGPHPTFPMGRYVSQPLTIQCHTLEEVRRFLRTCRAVSDEELFGKRDYWQPPEEFERRRAGDCEDFSLWTWRQLHAMGFDTRVVFGRHGRYGIGHAWVTFYQNGKCFLVEPQARMDLRYPRLSTLQYEPKFSVSWDGEALKYFAHKPRPGPNLHPFRVLPLIPEWCWYWLRIAIRLPYAWSRRAWRSAAKQER